MERELMMTGIGGQGVQLGAQVLARAAMAEGREVMLFGNYGGMMRGGNTDATLVVGDGPIATPPTIDRTWSAIVMHHEYWEPLHARLGPGSLVMVNTTVFDEAALGGPVDWSPYAKVDVRATDLAIEVGNVQAASMVMVGAYAAVTGLVALQSLVDAVEQSLPSYRRQHVALNVSALEVGWAAVTAGSTPAWDAGVVGVPA